jgi:heat shock protein HspQ
MPKAEGWIQVMKQQVAKFSLGQVVKHRVHPFRGVVFDVDAEFNNSDEWIENIPEDIRPDRDQPFYHLFAENESSYYVAYVSEQNLLSDDSDEPVGHPDVSEMFGTFKNGHYSLGSNLH